MGLSNQMRKIYFLREFMKQKVENMIKTIIDYAKCVGDADKTCVKLHDKYTHYVP